MPRSQVGNIHLSFLEDFLPVGMAILERVKKGGAREVLEGLTSSEKPIDLLRVEGASSALSVRKKLEQIKPGLGYPVVEVEVSVNPPESQISNSSDKEILVNILRRIDNRLDAIQNHLEKSTDLHS